MGFLLVAIFAGMGLYINTVSIIKKVKREEKTEWNTLFGCILIFIFIYSFALICAK